MRGNPHDAGMRTLIALFCIEAAIFGCGLLAEMTGMAASPMLWAGIVIAAITAATILLKWDEWGKSPATRRSEKALRLMIQARDASRELARSFSAPPDGVGSRTEIAEYNELSARLSILRGQLVEEGLVPEDWDLAYPELFDRWLSRLIPHVEVHGVDATRRKFLGAEPARKSWWRDD